MDLPAFWPGKPYRIVPPAGIAYAKQLRDRIVTVQGRDPANPHSMLFDRPIAIHLTGPTKLRDRTVHAGAYRLKSLPASWLKPLIWSDDPDEMIQRLGTAPSKLQIWQCSEKKFDRRRK